MCSRLGGNHSFGGLLRERCFGFFWFRVGLAIAEYEKAHERRKSSWAKGWGRWLPDKDSNLNKQSQNLLCYHYTIGQ